MDRKRKSTVPTTVKDGKKRRTYLQGASSETPHLSSALRDEDGIEYRLDSVFGLVKDIVSDIERGQGVDGISPPIKQAAFDLDIALSHARSLIQRHRRSAGHPVDVEESSTNNVEPSLPALPPISDQMLEKAVFTHPGVNGDIEATYDRLEILGDAYIELFATRLIWDRFHNIPSGQISQLRELLVKNESLAQYAIQYGLDSRANIPQDYLGQPKRWTKTMGDIFESYVAAIILSDPASGHIIAEKWLRQLWLPKLTDAGPHKFSLNAKDALARKIMGKGVKLKYNEERTSVQVAGGKQIFFIGVYLTGWGWTDRHLGSGRGPSKAVAGNEAAEQALNNEPLIGEVIHAKKSHEGKHC
ncbi:ribonuclease III [Aspergillus affinis]|uniref:ribonuclease III n=1 Tax=Aspergillus affinis TaxID=1070780 RepID=UPI0022FDD5B9|nr:RNase3 domain protein [Aspergillus affinis]KAI9041723.1 RNase3 domain protein [Aspergillus affinis]